MVSRVVFVVLGNFCSEEHGLTSATTPTMPLEFIVVAQLLPHIHKLIATVDC